MKHKLAFVAMGLSTLLSTALAQAADPAAAALRVGAAAVPFPVNDSMKLGGHMHPLIAAGQEGELRAVATVIEQAGSGKFAIVACDVLFITREMIDRCAALIQKSCGIDPAHLLVNATHTHNAPSTVRIHGTAAEPEFVSGMEASIVKAVEQANAKLTDNSRFLFHLGQEPNIGVNSRLLLPDGMISWGPTADPAARPTGPFDPELPVWVFRGPSDKLLSVIYNHSTHTVGSIRPNFRSPSFYGLAAQALEEKWGAPVCFLEGASGSTHNSGRSMEYMITELKRDVTEGVDQAKPREVQRIVAIKRPFLYQVRTFDEPTEDKKVVDYIARRHMLPPEPLDFVTTIFAQVRRGRQTAPRRTARNLRAGDPDRRRGPGRRAGRILHRAGDGNQTPLALSRYLCRRAGQRLDRLSARPRSVWPGWISNLGRFAQLD